MGWSRVNFSQYDDLEKLIGKVQGEYRHDASYDPRVVGRKKEEVKRFKSIKKGDKIVVPCPEYIAIATAGSAEIYDDKAGEQFDLANQRLVKYVRRKNGQIKEYPRSGLTENFLKRLNVRGSTCRDLNDFRDEILGLLSGKDAPPPSIEEELDALAREIPQEEWDKLPRDLSTNLDHYLYGTAKK
ncbi:MAG: hypothetical protein HYZ11_02915 [Candidatus Tectomicrobia bacterium]|uniref:Uncharacterized protein n=1 Tax=Tectimicrobiota bacterium TaxID=2528274 RepID=A0A932MNU6_UNCTE|nr:hypothetical protein [Candidatus Tectomicrobia bacterium]